MALAQRFNTNSQSTNGTDSGTHLSMNDIIPIQPISKGTVADDEKVTLQQLQSIPYGLGALNGSTYNVTLVNYPADYTLRVGSKMIVKFASAKSGSTALNLAINGQTIPMQIQGSSLTEISANQIIEFTFVGTVTNGVHTVTHANASAGITTSQLNGALTDYVKNIKCNGIDSVCYYSFVLTSTVTRGSGNGIEIFDRHGNKYTISISWTDTNQEIKINKEIDNGNTTENIIGFRFVKSSDKKTVTIIAKSNSWNIINGYAVVPSSVSFTYTSTPTTTNSNWDSGTDITVNKIATESSVNTTLANYTKVKIYENQTPSDTTNKFYTISDLDGKTVIKAEVFNQANKTAILYSFGEGKAPRIRFFDFSASAFNTSNALNNITKFKVYYHD